MKLVSIACFAMLFSFALISCKKGDTGPEGPQGPQGPIGVAGNANVTQYTFGTANFTISNTANLQVTTTADTMNRSAWFVYLVRPSGIVYPIPGFGLNGASDYRVYWHHSGGKVNFSITKISGPGEEYVNIRIIRIYANTVLPGGRLKVQPAGVDFGNYYEVCNYYGITN